MRKQNLLKLVMMVVAMFVFNGAMAQIHLTILNSDGTPSVGAIVYTLSSTDQTETTYGVAADAAGLVTWTPGANGKYFYLVKNGANYANFSVDYTGAVVNATVSLNTEFLPTFGKYVASQTGDKITIGKTMPFWVHPSIIHNPSYTAPSADFATPGDIVNNVISTFAWTKTGNGILVTDAGLTTSNDNYVEVNTNGANDGDIILIEALETAHASFGGCASATPVYFSFEAINPPYARITNATNTSYNIGGTPINTIAAGCTPLTNQNVTVAFGNNKEEFPYYMRATYTAYNATIAADGTVTLGSAVTFPDAKKPRGGVTPADPANQTSNPLKFEAAGDMYAASGMSFETINNKTTVYVFDLGAWNANISRKSDYLALDALTSGNIATGAYTWYTNLQNPTTDVTVAYLIVHPAPATGPIYHIPNSFGIF
jgi:hypothetical protein